jgi:transposase
MLRSRTVHTIHELAAQKVSIHEIARQTGLSRNTVRKYLRGAAVPAKRPPRTSKLDPFKDQIQRWIEQDHLLNCVTMLERLRPLGYTGGISQLKLFVHPLRPARRGRVPVRRYETAPGEQLQFDWGEFRYDQDGRYHKLFGFIAILSFSRMRFITFTKRCDVVSLIRSLMLACEYFGGLPQSLLTDRMKSVLLESDGTTKTWHPLFADFVAAIGVVPRVCRPYTPQTKGKVERSVGVIKQSFWPGVCFTDLEHLNKQARAWCEQRNRLAHQTTHERPIERWTKEGLRPLPQGYAWERFATEERKVSWDGYFSFDGVLYGLPSEPPLAGSIIEVRVQHGLLHVWSQGQLLLTLAQRARSGEVVTHPEQFRTVAPAASLKRAAEPLAHQIVGLEVARRSLAEYDQLVGGEVGA